jgi:hypothetical protein
MKTEDSLPVPEEQDSPAVDTQQSHVTLIIAIVLAIAIILAIIFFIFFFGRLHKDIFIF